MLGRRHHQCGLIHRTRLSKSQTDETQAGGKVRGEHLGCFAHGFGYTVFKEIARVARAPVVRVTAMFRRGGLSLIGENARRHEGAILRRRQPEGQKNDCNDATGKRHAHSGTWIGHSLSNPECPHLKAECRGRRIWAGLPTVHLLISLWPGHLEPAQVRRSER